MRLIVTILFFLSASIATAADFDFENNICFARPAATLYGEENFKSFPCDLSVGPMPRLLIVGEVHDWAAQDPTSSQDFKKSAKLGIEFRTEIEGLYAQGKLITGDEGILISRDGHMVLPDEYKALRSQSHYLGIDDTFVKSLHTLPLYWINGKNMSKAVTTASDDTSRQLALAAYRTFVAIELDIFWKSAYLQAIWKTVKRPLANSGLETWALYLDKYACDRQAWLQTSAFVDQLGVSQLDQISELLRAMIAQVPLFLNDIDVKQVAFDKLLLAKIFQKIAEGSEQNNGMDELSKLLMPIRNTLMSANIAKMYCAFREMGLPTVIRVGRLHVDPIAAKLSAMALQSGANSSFIRTSTVEEIMQNSH